MTEKAGSPQARSVLQQCLYAMLQVKLADDQSDAEWVEVLLNYVLLLFQMQIWSIVRMHANNNNCTLPKIIIWCFHKISCFQIDRGMVYICFFKCATEDIMPKMGRCSACPVLDNTAIMHLPGLRKTVNSKCYCSSMNRKAVLLLSGY